jgi:acetyltransferase
VRQEDVAEAVVKAKASHPEKTVLAVLMGREGLPEGRAELHEVGIPAFIFPESAARALGGLCRYREWRERPVPSPEDLRVDRARAAELLERARRAGQSRLDELAALALLEAYGVPTAGGALATSAEEAVALADRMRYPVVMKIVAPAIVHKTDVGGVQVGIGNAEEARSAFRQIMAGARGAYPDAPISGILVQRMLSGGRELIVGVIRDPLVGPLVMFGLGGVLVEALGDVVFRLAPIHRRDAGDMIRGIRGVRVLDGIRGAPPADLVALEEVLLRVSHLAADFPALLELDINPLLAFGDRAVAVDARVVVG